MCVDENDSFVAGGFVGGGFCRGGFVCTPVPADRVLCIDDCTGERNKEV